MDRQFRYTRIIKIGIFIFSFGLFHCFLFGQAQSSSFYKVKLGRVIDGDTFKVYLACSYKLFCSSVPVRVRGIDTPELRGKDPQKK